VGARADGARAHGVDVDLIRRQLAGERAREAHDAHLRRGVVHEADVAVEGGLGRHVHDAAALAGSHLLHREPAGPHRRQQRHLDDEAPRLLLGHVELGGPLPGALADIVEQDVDAPESAPDRGERLSNGHGVGPVRGEGQRLPAEPLDGVTHRVQRLALAVHDGEVGALARQAQRARATDPVRRAGDDRDPAREPAFHDWGH
jgi:hypothetical protein